MLLVQSSSFSPGINIMEETLRNFVDRVVQRRPSFKMIRVRKPKMNRSISEYVVSSSASFCLPIKIAAYDLAKSSFSASSESDDDEDDHGFVSIFSPVFIGNEEKVSSTYFTWLCAY